MTKIGWVPFKKSYSDKYHLIESLERMIKEPEKILDFYKKTKSMFKQCPSNFNFLKNFYVIKSPFDVEIKYFREEKRIWVSQKQGFVDHMVDPRFGQYTDTDKALCSVLVSYMFVADEPVWLEVYPPFLHGEVKNTKFISGTFDIHSWQRPVDFTFEILNDKKPIKIKENQPLYYVRFVSKKLNDDFNLKRLKWTEELFKAHAISQPQNYFVNVAWKLMKLGNKLRPKKFIK
jgi:hypothetical protein